MRRPTQMLSIKLKEKWHAIIATAGAARLRTARRNGPTVRRPGWLAGVACYQHERVIVALHLPGHDEVGDLLRRIGEDERLRESVPDAVREQNHGIAQGERYRARHGVRLLGADEACVRHERDARRAVAGIGAQQDAADVPDAEPRHRRRLRIEVGEAEHHAAQSDQGIVAAAHELDERSREYRSSAPTAACAADAASWPWPSPSTTAMSVPLPTRLMRQRSPDSDCPGNGSVANAASIFKSRAATFSS